jgi:lipopolysaccharide/colanic/teichoic acid biosynthesis glycosyltransferase
LSCPSALKKKYSLDFWFFSSRKRTRNAQNDSFSIFNATTYIIAKFWVISGIKRNVYLILKRILDVIVALVVLIVLLPLFIPICLLLRFTAEGEVFYLQKRVGYHNQSFEIWKFTTMLKNSMSMGTGSLTLRNDPRVTSIGKFLRMTKINELPQVINVLNGTMSLVGPRPQVEKDFQAYPEAMRPLIYNAKPGITGIGSIIFRDEEKLLSSTSMPPHDFYREHIAPYKGTLELWYQQHASMVTDLKIIFLTAWQIFFPQSNLVFKIFKDLPVRPAELNIQ